MREVALGNRKGETNILENPSIEVALRIIRTLYLQKVRRFAYCPGSRNAPFAYVLSAYEKAGLVEVATFVEERGAGFWAIGAMVGDPDRKPVAVITTSGTAVAELHPALEEAKHQGLPLIAVTADRPFELRGVGANQTTKQAGIFGNSVCSELDVPALENPVEEEILDGVCARVNRLVMRAMGKPGSGGPVHLNVAFRDPLVPAYGGHFHTVADQFESLLGKEQTSPTYLGDRPEMVGACWDEVVEPHLRTLLVAGDCDGERTGSNARLVAQYASQVGIPMIAEPSSGLTDLPNWLPHGQLIAAKLATQVQQIIVLGTPTLSRPIDRLLGVRNARKVVVSAIEEWPDTSASADIVVSNLILPSAGDHPQFDPKWRKHCESQSKTASEKVREAAEKSGGINHLSVVKAIWDSSENVALWLGASNTIRAFDIAANLPGRRQVYANRGLAGIDGTIASALGLQSSSDTPVRVVLGDLTFCYDLASLPARPTGDQDIQIVVFDDNGGSIFQSLEHGRVAGEETYDKFFAVSQSIDVCAIARACGWEAHEAQSIEDLNDVLSKPIQGRSVVRVPLSFPTRMFGRLREEVNNDLG